MSVSVCTCVCVLVVVVVGLGDGRWRENGRGGGGDEGLRDCGSACVDAGEEEGQSEICNALFNWSVYCNVSGIAL